MTINLGLWKSQLANKEWIDPFLFTLFHISLLQRRTMKKVKTCNLHVPFFWVKFDLCWTDTIWLTYICICWCWMTFISTWRGVLWWRSCSPYRGWLYGWRYLRTIITLKSHYTNASILIWAVLIFSEHIFEIDRKQKRVY